MTVLPVGTIETFGIFVFESPFDGKWWTLKSEHTPGDYSFDPAGLKPTDAIELKDMQTKELNNGRLAMIAIAGMVGREPRRAPCFSRQALAVPRVVDSASACWIRAAEGTHSGARAKAAPKTGAE